MASSPGVSKFVKDNWDHLQPLSSAITNFTREVKRWKVEVLGNLFTRKKKVLARLNGTQKALASNPNDFLVHLEK